MGYSSQSGQVLLRTQTAPEVFESDIDTDGIGVLLRSGSLGINRDLLTLDPEIGGGRDTTDAYLGPAHFAGDWDFYPRFDSLPTLLRACFGIGVSGTPTGGVTEHVFTPTDSGTLPFLSVYEDVGSGLQRSNFWDVVVNTIHFEAEPNGFFMGTAGMIGREAEFNVPSVSAPELFDNTPVAVGTSVHITYAGLTLPAKSFSLDVNNNVEDDDYRLGSQLLGDLTAKQREVTGSFSMRHAGDATLYRQAALGKAAATTIQGETTKDELKINLEAYKVIPTSLVRYSFEMTIPFAIYSPFSLEPSGDDILENDLDFTGLRMDKAIPIITAKLKNGRPDIA